MPKHAKTTKIHAKVNARLLGKAQRLFTGTLEGRITEVLQNARRAGATRVCITNVDQTLVTVRDDGHGIDDFAVLLDMGGSGWDHDCESAEDPAGVGLFCLAPRELTVRSNGQSATIVSAGWRGEAVEMHKIGPLEPCATGVAAIPPIPRGMGTELHFADETWTAEEVGPEAVFSGMDVIVDGKRCPREAFVSDDAIHHPALGCRIQIVRREVLSQWHRQHLHLHGGHAQDVLVNFHGQIVGLQYQPLDGSHEDLTFLVDLTGEPTGIRLMLPARTQLVENEALRQLKAMLEREAYLYVQRQGHHRLFYKDYLRARELGIELPEAQPVYRVGLIGSADVPEPIEVTISPGHELAKCYLAGESLADDADEANAHLLAALGRFEQSQLAFVPVEIDTRYDGYSWAQLGTIDEVEVMAGSRELARSWIAGNTLFCVDSITITVHCSDGRTFSSPVCMALRPPDKNSYDQDLYVTPEARASVTDEQVWFHLGGWSEDGDTYDTQLYDLRRELGEFWARVTGPHEPLRAKLMECMADSEATWESVTMLAGGRVTIRHKDGSELVIEPPPADAMPNGGR
jgi:hypothetical protein